MTRTVWSGSSRDSLGAAETHFLVPGGRLSCAVHAPTGVHLVNGYSDRINHALAFAAKHHDREVRRGTRLPYLTAAPDIAIILTRYGQDDDTVVAGILHGVVHDLVRDGASPEMLDVRIGEKFGAPILRSLLGVTLRRTSDDGIEMSLEERRDDLLGRLRTSDVRGQWVLAADLLHTTGTLLADLGRTDFPSAVWAQRSDGRAGAVHWFRRLQAALTGTGFAGAILDELDGMIGDLERRSGDAG